VDVQEIRVYPGTYQNQDNALIGDHGVVASREGLLWEWYVIAMTANETNDGD